MTITPAEPAGVVTPGHPEWDRVRTPWNLAIDQQPVAILVPTTAQDVAGAFAMARERGWRVSAQSTGHSAAALADRGGLDRTLLLNMSGMRGVSVDPLGRTARAAAGTVWGDVTSAAAEHGLAALAGSSPDVGVTGYTLGGGLSWLARSRGLAANQVTSVQIVTPDGTVRDVDDAREPDLFWALRGGGGNFGVVTSLQFRLIEMSDIFAGALFWPVQRCAEVMTAWREWVDSVPESVTSVARVMNFPPLPDVPEPLRGNQFVIVEAAMQVSDEDADDLLVPLRALGPAMDTFARIPMPQLAALHMDPPGPVPAAGQGSLLRDLDPATIAGFAELAAAEPALLSAEFRHLGGALTPGRVEGGAVSGLDAGFLFFAVGMAATPQDAQEVSAAVGRALDLLASVRAARAFVNFRETATDPVALYGGALDRLRDVQAQYDPDHVMRAHQPLS